MEQTDWEKFVIAKVKSDMKAKEKAGDPMSVWPAVKDYDSNQP